MSDLGVRLQVQFGAGGKTMELQHDEVLLAAALERGLRIRTTAAWAAAGQAAGCANGTRPAGPAADN